MGKRCLKCGYERHPTDTAPDYECPQCGVVYAKIEARQKENRENQSGPKIGDPDGRKRCPYCGEEILAVAIKCKHCGSDLKQSEIRAKTSNPRSTRNVTSRKLSLMEVVIGLTVGTVGIVFAATGSFDKIWAHLISPFDPKPTVSFSELVTNPEVIHSKKKQLCAWAKREELRNPTIWSTAARKSACDE